MEKKINIAELLKDCPKGMELDSPVWNNIVFEEIDKDNIIILRKSLGAKVYLSQYGGVNSIDGKCIIFPKGKTTWDGFKPPCKFKDGDVITCTNSVCSFVAIFKKMYTDTTFLRYVTLTLDDEQLGIKDSWSDFKKPRFATEEEKEKLFQAIKDHGYKWNAETKTLEKLIIPKFKVGDRIRHKDNKTVIIITGIKDNYYLIQFYNLKKNDYQNEKISFKSQDYYELIPNKFDINTLKPFESKVLVRDKNTEEWRGHFFSHCANNSDRPYVCIGTEGINEYKQCIPYNGNEHLLGTTNECDEYYKNW